MPPKVTPSCGCGFGHSKKKCAFGSSVDTFFEKNNSNMAFVNNCLSTTYGKPVTRFGDKSGLGPMKVGKKK